MAKDVLKDLVYEAIKSDPLILSRVEEHRIKFYEYPSTGDFSGPFVIIDPLDAPSPEDYADDTWLTWDFIYQIEVWGLSRTEVAELNQHLVEVLWSVGFRPAGGGLDEWDRASGIFRQARRYRGRVYRENIN